MAVAVCRRPVPFRSGTSRCRCAARRWCSRSYCAIATTGTPPEHPPIDPAERGDQLVWHIYTISSSGLLDNFDRSRSTRRRRCRASPRDAVVHQEAPPGAAGTLLSALPADHVVGGRGSLRHQRPAICRRCASWRWSDTQAIPRWVSCLTVSAPESRATTAPARRRCRIQSRPSDAPRPSISVSCESSTSTPARKNPRSIAPTSISTVSNGSGSSRSVAQTTHVGHPGDAAATDHASSAGNIEFDKSLAARHGVAATSVATSRPPLEQRLAHRPAVDDAGAADAPRRRCRLPARATNRRRRVPE